MALNRDQILSADDLKRETVDVPEWGGSVIVRSMSGRDRANFLKLLEQNADDFYVDAKLLSCSLIDDNGELLFPDVNDLVGKNAGVIRRLAQIAGNLSAIGPQAVEDAEKN